MNVVETVLVDGYSREDGCDNVTVPEWMCGVVDFVDKELFGYLKARNPSVFRAWSIKVVNGDIMSLLNLVYPVLKHFASLNEVSVVRNVDHFSGTDVVKKSAVVKCAEYRFALASWVPSVRFLLCQPPRFG
jgi:hypothetical protein